MSISFSELILRLIRYLYFFRYDAVYHADCMQSLNSFGLYRHPRLESASNAIDECDAVSAAAVSAAGSSRSCLYFCLLYVGVRVRVSPLSLTV